MNAEGTRDLAWWQVPRWTSALPRVLVTVFVLFVVSVPLVGLVAQLYLLVPKIGPRIEPAAYAAYFGDALEYGFIFGFGLMFAPTSGGRLSQQRCGRQWSRTDNRTILIIGLGIGLVNGLQFMRGYGLGYKTGAGPGTGLLVGLVTGLVAGLGFVLSGGPPQRWSRLRWSRTNTSATLLLVLVLGAGLGVVVGLVDGLVVGIGYGLVSAFSEGPSQRQGWRRWSRTYSPMTLVIGLVIGLVNGPGYGLVYLLVVVLSGGPPQQWGKLRWSRTDTPTTLLVGLMYGLVIGLVFGLVYNFGLVFGLLAGLGFAFLFGFGQPSTVAVSPLDPQSLWHRERQFGVFMGLVIGFLFGLAGGLVEGLMHHDYGLGYGLGYGLVEGPVVGLGIGLVSSATWAVMLTSAQLRLRGEAPVRLMRFLNDAHTRQILRTVGPVYQFRHARLQDRLAGMREEEPRIQLPVALASSDKDV